MEIKDDDLSRAEREIREILERYNVQFVADDLDFGVNCHLEKREPEKPELRVV